MRYLPISLDTKERNALVLGGGLLAFGRIKDLLATDYQVYAINESFVEDIKKLDDNPQLHLKELVLDDSFEFFGYDFLVIATSNFELNNTLEDKAMKKNLLYERCDVTHDSTARMNTVVKNDVLSVALLDNTTNPVITKIIEKDVKELLDSYDAEKITILNAIRGELLRKNAPNIDATIEKLYYEEKITAKDFYHELTEDAVSTSETETPKVDVEPVPDDVAEAMKEDIINTSGALYKEKEALEHDAEHDEASQTATPELHEPPAYQTTLRSQPEDVASTEIPITDYKMPQATTTFDDTAYTVTTQTGDAPLFVGAEPLELSEDTDAAFEARRRERLARREKKHRRHTATVTPPSTPHDPSAKKDKSLGTSLKELFGFGDDDETDTPTHLDKPVPPTSQPNPADEPVMPSSSVHRDSLLDAEPTPTEQPLEVDTFGIKPPHPASRRTMSDFISEGEASKHHQDAHVENPTPSFRERFTTESMEHTFDDAKSKFKGSWAKFRKSIGIGDDNDK
ncbi:hypothetical protein O6R05_06240 [Peptoniphilus equinus]|uniref:precorrin-2 dehydrogenase n=1 Tax=Peptoniphilus equinus TaxID=3016343 RepID=A0ABY7QS26_9FIRM|nr:NAD(P)-dependent oxidoreductase [Peptoniphilus equinus]WBW49593.1 hypothetical protein O6R05_06240 [Peptoniphilus equinus]